MGCSFPNQVILFASMWHSLARLHPSNFKPACFLPLLSPLLQIAFPRHWFGERHCPRIVVRQTSSRLQRLQNQPARFCQIPFAQVFVVSRIMKLPAAEELWLPFPGDTLALLGLGSGGLLHLHRLLLRVLKNLDAFEIACQVNQVEVR